MRALRQGWRTAVVLVGAGLVLLLLAEAVQGALAPGGRVSPGRLVLLLLGVVVVMGGVLGGELLRARRLVAELGERKDEADREVLRLRQDIAHVDRVSMLGQLASTLAHEINQPLGAILRNAEAAALFMQDPTPDLHEISAILEDIRKDDQRAGEVIDRIRTLLRREEVAMARLDVAQALGDVATLLRPDAAARHVAFELKVPAELPAVRGDPVQIQQVLLNLILNGMDALAGVVDRGRCVTVSARREGTAHVEIGVADTGRGVPADELARIFEPFFTTKARGIGMGLSISRGIVEAHGGRLWAENNPDGGATFRFTVPVVAGPAAEKRRPAGGRRSGTNPAGEAAQPVRLTLD